MSEVFKHTAGLQNVGSYQVSGKPFVTASTVTDGSEQQIEFPEVSNNITVKLDSSGGQTKNVSFLNVSTGSGDGYALRANNLSTSFSPDYGLTFSLWFRSNLSGETVSSTTDTFLNVYPSSNQRGVIGQLQSDQTLRFVFYYYDNNTNSTSGETGVSITTSTSLNNGEFYNIILSISGGTGTTNGFNVYLNSNLEGTQNIPSSKYRGQWNSIQFDNWADDGANFDPMDISIWNKAFSQQDVNALYNNGFFVESNTISGSNLVNRWTFDSNDGSIVESVNIEIVDTIATDNFVGTQRTAGETAEFLTHTFTSGGGSGGELRIHFRSTGSSNVATNRHYWTLDSQNESITMNVKSKELYLSADGGDCDYSVEAELTGIDANLMYQHTGSGVDE